MSKAKSKRGFWRTLRVYFRRFRITVWLIVLFILGSAVYVNQIGLPGFIKQPLLQRLRERGIDLQFSRLRIRWYQGIVAEHVRFGRPIQTASPNLTADQVQVHLNGQQLLHFRIQVDSLTLRKGKLTWPLVPSSSPSPATGSSTNEVTERAAVSNRSTLQPTNTSTAQISDASTEQSTNSPSALFLENVQTDLRLGAGDQWLLDDLTANFAGARIHLSGSVTNASAIRDWTFLHGRKRAPLQAGVWQRRLNQLAHLLDRIQFSTPPDLILSVRGDGHDPESFNVRLMVNTPGATTPWGSLEQGKFSLRLFPRETNEPTHAELTLEAADAKTPWATVTNLSLTSSVLALGGESNLFSTTVRATAGSAETKWGSAVDARLEAHSIHTFTNPIPVSGEATVTCFSPTSQWGSAQSARLSLALRTPSPDSLPQSDGSWYLWEKIRPFILDWSCDLAHVQSTKLQLAKLNAGGTWQAPQLSITNLHSELYSGSLDGAADLNIASRSLSARVRADLDVHQAESLITEGGRRWLSQFSWQTPPRVTSGLTVTLPAWTNRHPDWRKEVLPTLVLDGEFKAEHGGAFLQIPISTARSHFVYSNMTWNLPDLLATRPEGNLNLHIVASDLTKKFYFHARSSLDPMLIRPMLETNAQRGFDLVKLTQPPAIDAEVWGRWRHHEEIGFKAAVAVTNFSFRGQHADTLTAQVEYTNKTLMVRSPEAHRGREQATADFLFADFNQQKIWVTNGFSNMDPMVIGRAIGPHVTKNIESYRFDIPPAGRVNGIIPMRHERDADLHFELVGGPFHWWKINVPQIAGNIDWVGDHLKLRNVRGDFYGGRATGEAAFDFTPHKGADYHFYISATNAILEKLMADLAPKTNALEGLLSGNLVITRASTWNTNALAGYGNIELHEGLLWAIPIFGIFSPVLDSVSPGLGSSRASSGAGTFTITNGIIRSDDLEIRSPALRLQYRGAVGIDGKVDARVDAVLLRDMWVLGPLVSTVFWPFTKLFEYQVTGSLAHPKLQPVYFVPKLMTLPFHPLRSIKEMMPEEQPPQSDQPKQPAKQ